MPIIEDNGKVVNDSFAIAQYLESTYTERPSLFGGPGGGYFTVLPVSFFHLVSGALSCRYQLKQPCLTCNRQAQISTT